MTNLCNPVTIEIYDGVGELQIREILAHKMTLSFDCGSVDLADFDIKETCLVRKMYKVKIYEGIYDIFTGYIYSHKTERGSKITKIQVNSEKWLFKRLYPTADVNYTGSFNTLIQTLIDQQNSILPRPQFSFQFTGSGDITINATREILLLDIFDSIANQTGLSRYVHDNMLFFGVVGLQSEYNIHNDGTCNSNTDVTITEAERYSRVVTIKGNSVLVVNNYVYGNFGMIRKEVLGDQTVEGEKRLNRYLGENFVYEVQPLQDIHANVCDTVNMTVSNCGDRNFYGMIKVQQKKVVYEGFMKKITYVMSNGEIRRLGDILKNK